MKEDTPNHSLEVTQLLVAVSEGERDAPSQLLNRVYDELRRLAGGKMAREEAGNTLQATALVHEAWMVLTDKEGRANFKNRAHFFGAASEAMRRILVDGTRKRRAKKRGGEFKRDDQVELSSLVAPGKSDEILAVSEALDKLARIDPRKAELIKLRYFVGLTFDELAPILDISVPTAHREWSYSRAWLSVEIGRQLE